MRILCINLILYLIRLVRLDWRMMKGCIINNERLGHVWELHIGYIFIMEDESEILMAVSEPMVCWRSGSWGIMSLPVRGEWQTPEEKK